MNFFFQRNKTFVGIIIAALIIGGSIYLSNSRKSSEGGRSAYLNTNVDVFRTKNSDSTLKSESSIVINFNEAPKYIGEYITVAGKVDNVYTSLKGNSFINFCSNYKTCPFFAVIFNSDSYKFPNIKQYQGKTVQITGVIKTYRGRAEIIISNPNQIKIK